MATKCLHVAIDHRIRRLLKPGQLAMESPSSHIHIQKLGQLYPLLLSRRKDDPIFEVLVTEQLAQPRRQGGILVALARPANNHPFSEGVDVVVEKCPTLRALRDIFLLMELDLVTQITVLDSLPLLPLEDREQMLKENRKAYVPMREEHHAVFLEAVVAKHPEVVLCMWQREKKPEEGRWVADAIESIGVGGSFDSAAVTLNDRLGNRVETQRVNGFHPSYSMFHNPGYSQFRQLLILEVAHACYLSRGHWEEEPWMDQLREDCKLKARILAKGNSFNPLDESSLTRITEPKSEYVYGITYHGVFVFDC